MRTVLTIGREPDNDLVINLPIVSGRHARVTWEGVPGRAVIEDLGSSNGTAINQMDRKITRSTLTASDVVYLGNHPIPGSELLSWVDPSLAPSLHLHGNEMVIGREPGCHRVIDRATISGRHARLRRTGDRIILEDLGSSNGTFVNGMPIQEPTEVRPGDLIGLGVDAFRLATGPSAAVAGTQKLDAIAPAGAISPGPSPTIPIPIPARPIAPRGGLSAYPIVLAALVLQAPLIAALIGLMSGNNATSNPGIAKTLFALGLASAWFGLSTAIFGLLLDPARPVGPGSARPWLARLALLGGLCVGEGVLAQVVAYPLAGLQGSSATALFVLVLTSGVGLALGTLIVLLAPSPTIAWSALVATLFGLSLFGGGPPSLPRSGPMVRIASDATPTRWALEALLEAEAAARRSSTTEQGLERDVAEDAHPEAGERMGPRAAEIALASMLIGLVGLGAFVVRSSGVYR